MSLRRHFTLATAGIAMTWLAAAGVSQVAQAAEVMMVMATLSAAQEVPPNPSTGTGELTGQFDPATHTLSYQVTYSGLTGPVKMGHFHGPAPLGQNAGVAVAFAPPLDSPIKGTVVLTTEQEMALLAGHWYVNLHTAENPKGEVRGQVMAH